MRKEYKYKKEITKEIYSTGREATWIENIYRERMDIKMKRLYIERKYIKRVYKRQTFA